MPRINKSKPLVSVLVCAFNAEKYISTTLDSLINQKYKNVEYFVLNNNSVDNTRLILDSYSAKDVRIKVFHSKINKGAYGGLNYLLNKAQGNYIAIADHDDIYHPDRVGIQVDFLEKHSKYFACGTNAYKYFEKNKEIKFMKTKKIDTFAFHPSLMFRNVLDLKYNLNIRYKADTYFMKYVLCQKSRSKIFNIQKPLFLSRVREDGQNLSRILNSNLSLADVMNYYLYSKDALVLLRHILKIVLNYNLTQSILDNYGRKSIKEFKQDKFLNEYLGYL